MTTSNSAGLSSRPKPGDDQMVDRDLKREEFIFQAQLCEQSNRFDDMVMVMNEICRTYADLTEEERNLLSCAYKNVIGSRRTSWRIIHDQLKQLQPPTVDHVKSNIAIPASNLATEQQNLSIEADKTAANLTQQPSNYNPITVKNFLACIEAELEKHCGNIIDILTNRLIPSVINSGESRVFYYKMKGDFLRYLSEISHAHDRKERSNEALLAYRAACDKAMIDLPPTHPVRLGLMLNFSVFYYDIMKSPERSCRLAKQAFDDAIAELDTLSEESYRDSTIIMQLLRDNLNLWESEQINQTNSANSSNNNNLELIQG